MSTVEVARAGIDTFSACWHVDSESPAARAMEALATQPASRGKLIPEPIAGQRVGWHPGVGMIYAEGHPGAPDELAPPSALGRAVRAVKNELSDRGVQLPDDRRSRGSAVLDTCDGPGFSGVRRVDATVDLRAGSTEEGVALLTAVAAVATVTPRSQADVRFAKDASGGVETVYQRGAGGKRILARWYDKGLESAGASQRGQLIRAEDQRRYPSGRRPPVEAVTAARVRGDFQARFYPMYEATKGVKVLAQVSALRELDRRVEAGELRPTSAEKLAGYIVLRSVRGAATAADHRRERRRRQQLRQLGLVQLPAALSEVEFDLHQVLEQMLDADPWRG